MSVETSLDSTPSNDLAIKKILIANRGAIACRIVRTLKKMGIVSVALYSEADKESLHVREADEAYPLQGKLSAESYLDQQQVLGVAKQAGVQAVHPGYGFLSENTDFAEACEAAGIQFIGPTSDQIRQFGLKHTARDLALSNGVPLVPGTPLLQDKAAALTAAEEIGFPIMLKSTAGGGGIGMQVCNDAAEVEDAFGTVQRLSQNNFDNDGVFLEKFVANARHIEIQIIGDGLGHVVALGERDCSLQRRNQKVIEETPAPNLSDELREAMVTAAIDLAKAVNYRSAGTVEFIFDVDAQAFYFLEMNTRLQVEHGVTEAVTGVDLVEWMVRVAAQDYQCLYDYQHHPAGHAVQARLYAEDPYRNFQPSSGVLSHVAFGEQADGNVEGRYDYWIETGVTVSPYYDPMLAKLISHKSNREEALTALKQMLNTTVVEGIATNCHYLSEILSQSEVRAGIQTTAYLNSFDYQGIGIDVIAPGTQTTVQDYPGRVGFWDVGVPPSGPMDQLSFQLGNSLLGNDESAAGLEMTLTGPTLEFRSATTIALTGAEMEAWLLTPDGKTEAVPFWSTHSVPDGSRLTIGKLVGAGMRSYLTVKGGLNYQPFLGSASTFTLGKFGGHVGRALQVGDLLPLACSSESQPAANVAVTVPAEYQPKMANNWEIAVLYGPHGAPEFFTEDDIKTFFDTNWEIHFNSSRTGVRLIGPKPEWARTDGGEAGLHPSNIHDNAYAVGAVDFTGDMPVILGPDGPSLGGFVCPVTIIKADMWKLGQLKPGDTIRFYPVSYTQAESAERAVIAGVTDRKAVLVETDPTNEPLNAILAQHSATDGKPEVVYRASGDDNILIEFGPMELDLELRFCAHALMEAIRSSNLQGVIDLTPGIRSLQVHYNNLAMSQTAMLAELQRIEQDLPPLDELVLPTRIVHLPLSWDDSATRLAIDKYMTTVRPDAPWCPSNIEFIRRINGLDSIDTVKRIVFDASYLVMGLGDVYLGAPVATPLDPRHRLVTTKYNPARTWTPENAVGIGGAYMCVYGMEGPGGYQFVGRTLQMWNRYRETAAFSKPWLLRFFDQIRFYEVSETDLLDIREDFPLGKYPIKIEASEFSLGDYRQFLAKEAENIADFQQQQRTAFNEERQRWQDSNIDMDLEIEETIAPTETELNPGEVAVFSTVPGSVWQVKVDVDSEVELGTTLAVIESMKMEFPVDADVAGRVVDIKVDEGQQITAGQVVIVIATEESGEEVEQEVKA